MPFLIPVLRRWQLPAIFGNIMSSRLAWTTGDPASKKDGGKHTKINFVQEMYIQ